VTRRPVLPGASELFRRTDTKVEEAEVTELPSVSATTSSPALRSGVRRDEQEGGMPLTLVPGGASDDLSSFRAAVPSAPTLQPHTPTRGRPARNRERTKHDEKITVYISADELLALETARLILRGKHGVAADRGRIVREAIAVLLADLDERGDDAVLVQRLRGK
jgi:hypothetical protein